MSRPKNAVTLQAASANHLGSVAMLASWSAETGAAAVNVPTQQITPAAINAPAGSVMSIREFVRNVYTVQKSIKPGTLHDYNTTINNANRYLGRPSKLGDLCDSFFDEFTTWLAEQGRSKPTINKNLRNLLAIARLARKRRLITYFPDVNQLSEMRRQPVAWKLVEVNRLVAAIRKEFGNTNYGLILRAQVYVIYDTGLRVGDTVAIRYVDYSRDKREIRLVEQKTGRQRGFVLHDRTIEAIDTLRERLPYSDHLLCYEFKTTTPLRDRLRMALIAAGLPHDRKSLFHKLRRTTATLARNAGLDPTDVLGHSARWVTRAYYIDETDAPPMDVASKLPALSEPTNQQAKANQQKGGAA